MITLTAEERRKFSAWLRQDADSNEKLIIQMRGLSYAGAIVEVKMREITAAIVVADGLDSTEEVTIG